MENESEDVGEEMPSRVTNAILEKIMKEHMDKTNKMDENIKKLEEM